MGSLAFDYFLVPCSLFNPPTVPLTTLIKDDWPWGPEFRGRVTKTSSSLTLGTAEWHSWSRCFLNSVIPSHQLQSHPDKTSKTQNTLVKLSHRKHSRYKFVGLTLSFTSLLSGARLSWSFLFLCLSLISAKLWEKKQKLTHLITL